MPEQAIIRSADASKPTKARVDDTNHPKITVEFDAGETQYAVVRLLIPPQDEVGAFDSDARLDLRYVSASALTGNVQFGVKYALIDLSEGQDKALSSEVASTTSSYTGSANTEYGVSFTLTGVFSGLDTTKRYTLVLQLTRKQPASDLAADVKWTSGVLRLNQVAPYATPTVPTIGSPEIWWDLQSEAINTLVNLDDISGNTNDSTNQTTLSEYGGHPVPDRKIRRINGVSIRSADLDVDIDASGGASMDVFIVHNTISGTALSMAYRNSTPKYGFGIQLNGGTINLCNASGAFATIAAHSLDLGMYHLHLRRIVTAGTAVDSIWVDGNKMYETAGFTPFATGSGWWFEINVGGLYFTGSDIRFWTTPLTDAQIRQITHGFKPWLRRDLA